MRRPVERKILKKLRSDSGGGQENNVFEPKVTTGLNASAKKMIPPNPGIRNWCLYRFIFLNDKSSVMTKANMNPNPK